MANNKVTSFPYARFLAAVSVCAFVGLPHAAEAQNLPQNQPGQVERRFEAPELPLSTEKPILPKIEQDRGQQVPAGGEDIRFVLKGLNVSGSTVYTPADLRPLYEEQLNTEVTLALVFDLAAKITAKYRNDGYILSRAIVPPQRVANGIIEIRIIEGFIDRIGYEGEFESSSTLLDKYASRVTSSRPLKAEDLERFVLLANDLPGVDARVVLLPSQNTVGASDVVVVLTQTPYEGSLSMDNRGSRYLGPIQISAAATANSFFDNYEQITFRHVTSAQRREFNLYEINFEQPFGPDGLRFNASGSRSFIQPGYDIRQFEVESDSLRMTAAVTYPWIRTREENLSISTTFDYRDSTTIILGTKTSEDNIRSLRLNASYDFLDGWRGINLFNASVTQGLDVIGSTASGSSLLSRQDGRSDFTKFNLDVLRLQNLAPHWNLYLAATGQYSLSQLLSAEEFGYGGAQFGRAYDPSELTGDHGFAAQAELRYQNSLDNPWVSNYELFTFYDFGATYRINPTDNEGTRVSGSSVGGGVRFGAIHDISGTLEVAVPLTKTVDTRSSNDVSKGDDARFFFSVIKTF